MQTSEIDILAQILESSSVAVVVVDEESRFTLFNRGAELLTGYRREEILGRSVAVLFEARDDVHRLWELARREPKLENYEATILDRQGRPRPISLLVAHLRDADGRPTGSLLGIGVDLSDRERLERDLRRAKQRTDFYNDLLCHDVRNFDQTILGYLEVLLSGKTGVLGWHQARLLRICRRQTQRMRELVDRVRILARMEEQPPAPPASMPLGPAVEEVVARVAQAYADREAELRREVPADCRVMAGALLGEALYDLVTNGVVHNRSEHPWVAVSVQPGRLGERASWRILVEDNGTGIAPERKDELFERFTRLHTRGSGIGLSLVKAVVEAYGGRVWVEDRVSGHPEQGSRFVVELAAG